MAQYLTFYRGLFRWRGPYDTRDIPKQAGFRWNPDERQWQTRDHDKALRLRNYCDSAAIEELNLHLQRQRQEVEASRAVDADIHVPVPDGLAYLGYQKAGVAYLSSREGAILGDEMGLGKTIQAIGLMNYLGRECNHVLVVCPSSLKINWARELERWLVRPLSVGIASGQTWPDSDVVIVNYDVLHRHERRLRSRVWDVVVIDEAHYIKNPKAKRTLQIVGKRRWDPDSQSWKVDLEPVQARHRVLMTGTPIYNRPQDLWTLVDYAMLTMPAWQRPEHFRSRTRFLQRYAGYREGRYGWEFTGPQNMDELHEHLRRTVLIRRLKSQVLTELPPKIRQVVELDSTGYTEIIRAEYEQAQKQQALADAQAALAVAKTSGSEEEYRRAVQQLRQAQQIAFAEMSRVRHEVGMATAEAGVEHISNAVENSQKVVVFAHHRDVIDYLRQRLEQDGWKVVTLVGGMSGEEKQKAVDAFQTDPSVNVFIGSLTAAGTGITLTAASHVVFVELDWVPSTIDQAEDRCHRITQDQPVLVQHLVLEGSLTAKIARTIVEKQETNERILDGKGRGSTDSPGYLDEPVVPVPDDSGDIQQDAALMPRERIDAEADAMTDSLRRDIYAALRAIAAGCDGALRLDESGFNRMDAAIGRRLAAVPEERFTSRMAVLARRILRGYRRQIPADLYERICSA